jgi:hypothetical protein
MSAKLGTGTQTKHYHEKNINIVSSCPIYYVFIKELFIRCFTINTSENRKVSFLWQHKYTYMNFRLLNIGNIFNIDFLNISRATFVLE